MKKIVKNAFLISCGILMSLSFVSAKGTSFKQASALSSNSTTDVETYYSSIKIDEPDKLLGKLHDLMVNTHRTYTTYDNCKDSDIIYSIEPGTTSEYITDFYTQNNIARERTPHNAGGLNRAHVWCQSHSIDADTGTQLWGTKGGGSDLHHVRPIEYTLNSKRNNTPYGKAINRVEAKSKSDINTFAYLGGYLDTRNDIFEPLDTVKGDVARILFYDYTHYSSYRVIGGTTNGDQNKCNTYGHLLITNIVNTP
ncbi:MAG: endonuclease, partial [Clostridia bacterium]|nr:endonuclease [Clostridia bacterium]